MKSLAVIAVLAFAGCANRNSNLYARYTGVVLLAGGAAMITGPYLNGIAHADPTESKGFDTRLPGAGIAAVGLGLVIATLLVHPVEGPVSHEALRQREITLQADAMLHQAEAAAATDDCATVNRLAPQIELLDAGVGAVLRSNVAAARCLAAREKLPISAWLRHD